jgi:hypothetical protein
MVTGLILNEYSPIGDDASSSCLLFGVNNFFVCAAMAEKGSEKIHIAIRGFVSPA